MDNKLLPESIPHEKDILEYAKNNQPQYIIGVDSYDKENLAYTLARNVNGKVEFLVSKSTNDDTEFKEQIRVLSKVFNADVYEEK